MFEQTVDKIWKKINVLSTYMGNKTFQTPTVIILKPVRPNMEAPAFRRKPGVVLSVNYSDSDFFH